MQVYDNMSPNSSWNEKYFKRCRENKKKNFLHSENFPPENHADCEMMWKNVGAGEAIDASIGLNTASALCMLDAGTH